MLSGGFSNNYEKLSTMKLYDDENDKWKSMPSLNETRSFFNAVNIPWRLAEATLSREVPK